MTVKFEQTAQSPRQVLGHTLFHGVPEDVVQLLLRDAAILHVQAAEVLFREGEDAVEYLYVLSGSVEVLRHTQDAQERVFQIFQPGQLLAETAMFMTHGRYPMEARARSDGVVQCLKRAGLQEAVRLWPELAKRLLTRLSDRVYARVNEVEWYSESTAAQRLADYLLRLSGGTRQSVHLPLTQRQLAVHLGVRAETLSRLLADWVSQGRIAGARRNWVLLDPEFLETLVQAARRRF
ncbi:Crp/Fnr family transcriptional regulator [Castellaniella caeni]|uniref:Crp/Fnr family transcriptional regulator n=1 Tax=Castellaniella caeni TaxID=266123 RepID=UPI00083779BB|nr:Crp/Fnr family transcriptional regulator [Castellaniella caeni]